MSQQNSLKPIIIGCSVLALVCIAILCGAGGLLWHEFTKPIRHNPGSETPVVLARSAGGWATYRIPNCSLTIDLKSEPKVSPYTPPVMAKLFLKSYARYQARDQMNVYIYDRILRRASKNDRTAASIERAAERDPQVTELESDTSETTVDQHKATLETLHYKLKGKPMDSFTIVMTERLESISIRCNYPRSLADGKASWDRIVKSIHWTPLD